MKLQKKMRHHGQSGAVLIEALISILIFSIGVIALVGLQLAMTKNVTSSKLRGEASYLANQLIGLMWVAPGNLSNFAIASGACTNTYASCSNWLATVVDTLPGGSATVTVNGAAVGITVSWQLPDEMPSQYQIDANITN